MIFFSQYHVSHSERNLRKATLKSLFVKRKYEDCMANETISNHEMCLILIVFLIYNPEVFKAKKRNIKISFDYINLLDSKFQ